MTERAIDIVEIFRDEAESRLDDVVNILIRLEAGETVPQAVSELFRHAHTLKGTAAMFGHDQLEILAHRAEDILHVARGLGHFDASLTPTLLGIADEMRTAVFGEDDPSRAVRVLQVPEPLDAPLMPPTPPTSGVQFPTTAVPRPIRVQATTIDQLLDVVGETILHHQRLENELGAADQVWATDVAEELDAGRLLLNELREVATDMRTLPISSIACRFPRVVRDLAMEQGKDVDFRIDGAETELDRTILDGIAGPIVHLLRNAIAHGVESPEERIRAGKPATATLDLRLTQRGGLVEFYIRDDGRGVSPEVLALVTDTRSIVEILTEPGFSTAREISRVAGRGVGLDAVRRYAESCRGSIDIRSTPGVGTEITLLVPLALAMLDVFVLERDGRSFCLPLGNVEEVVTLDREFRMEGRRMIDLKGDMVCVADVADVLGQDASMLAGTGLAVVVSVAGRRRALACDAVHGEQAILVKGLGMLAPLENFLGAAILSDGSIGLILDPTHMVSARETVRDTSRRGAPAPVASTRVLVVEDSFTIREMQRSILESSGFHVTSAQDGFEALDRLEDDRGIALVLTDLDMPRMNGFELTEAIRAHPTRGSLPIVMVTSRASEGDSARGVEVGVDAYIVKHSFDQDVMLETIRRLVER